MAAPPPPTAATQALALAIVKASVAPVVLLSSGLDVLAASASFCQTYGIDPTRLAGRSVFELGEGQWNVRKLRSLLQATSSGFADVGAYEMDLVHAPSPIRRLVVNARRLEVEGGGPPPVLVTISDVTEARNTQKSTDNLLREKSILLQEVQHRVANSLQIIASVLLQSARSVQSDESRAHLSDAHNRVMSIAAVQKQLATSRLGEVELRPYFIQLCDSLGASMISDHDQLTIMVTVDDSVVASDISVSLGLIVTELVINALKHAVPAARKGRIMVDYRSQAANWTLSVGDDGVGMPKDAASATAGLGTNIVQALAKQLRAIILVEDAKPGTTVSITHRPIAAIKKRPAVAGL